jgi:hypothetical protein
MKTEAAYFSETVTVITEDYNLSNTLITKGPVVPSFLSSSVQSKVCADYPSAYRIRCWLAPTIVTILTFLSQVLSVDYDYVSDSMLAALSEVRLIRFIIHVHGIEETHPGTSNAAWTNFVRQKWVSVMWPLVACSLLLKQHFSKILTNSGMPCLLK